MARQHPGWQRGCGLMITVQVRGLDQLRREMTRLNVAVARRLPATPRDEWRQSGRGQGAAALADSGGGNRNLARILSGYRLASIALTQTG
jgi:hypothetical protein